MLLISGHKSDRGLLRENNEDSFFVNDKVGVYIVADGMGGHEGGEIASDIAVNTLGKILSNFLEKIQEKGMQYIIHNALQEANEEINLVKNRHIELSNMGTTVVLSIFFNDTLYYSHLGDSRAYLYKREGKLIQLTCDHSLVTEMVKGGFINKGELRTHKLRNIVTKYLGSIDLVLPEVQHCHVGVEDSIILCSDGLTNMLEETEILSIVNGNISMGPQIVCNTLVDQANIKGGDDNITVIVVQNK
jgi:PPM family protein phosphatase